MMKQINISNICHHPNLTPKIDPTFTELFKLTLKGKIPVYRLDIPIDLIQPFDKEFHPQNSPDGRRALTMLMDMYSNGKSLSAWVYPKDKMFVLSDDYLAYETARLAGAGTITCFCMGNPAKSGIYVNERPLRKTAILKSINCSMLST